MPDQRPVHGRPAEGSRARHRAFRQQPRASNVNQNARRLRGNFGGGHHFIDGVGALAAGVDDAGHSIGQAAGRSILETQRVGVDVDGNEVVGLHGRS